MSIHFGDKNVKEIRYGQKKVKEVWYGDKKVWPSGPSINLDPNSDQPIGRMDDGELWFRVRVKDPSEPFKIAVNGETGVSYDWDISVDGSPVIRKQGNKSTSSITIPMSVGKHYVKITPHNGVTAGWARCLGNNNTTNYWNNNKNKLEFGLEWLPGYAFMESGTSVGDRFLEGAWRDCTSLTSMPNEFNIPQGVTSVGNGFLSHTWYGCTSLTSIPSGFNIPQGITSVGNGFLSHTWNRCTSLTSMPNGFNIPQDITGVGDDFLYATWYSCTSLISMPSGFNIPQGITSVGKNFLSVTWRVCRALRFMPSGFNIPQGITNAGRDFAFRTWDECSLLTSNSPAEPINFPRLSSLNYGQYCFGGSCTITPDTPTRGSSVMVTRNP